MAIGFIIASSESYNGTGGNIQVIPDNVMNRTSTPNIKGFFWGWV